MNMSAQAIDDTCYLKEIQNYADLTAGMLGYTLPPCAGQERIRRCHKILSKYPYAYPLALELSLLLPSAMAITWLRAIHSTFYARADVLEEIDTFLVWRMSPRRENGAFFYPPWRRICKNTTLQWLAT